MTVVQDLSPGRRQHILEGDPPEVRSGNGGGHRSGTNKPGKTEFPADWTDDDIIRRVMETARHPETAVWQDDRGTWRVTAVHDDVVVTVAVDLDGQVVTAFPIADGRRGVRNPRRGTAG